MIQIFKNINLISLSDRIQKKYGQLESGAFVVDNGNFIWVGEGKDLPEKYISSDSKILDLKGSMVTPGFIDCHTHLVYSGCRSNEFEKQLDGMSYVDILKQGGGINSTVRYTREACEEELLLSATSRLENLRRSGVTTVEIKSGYGLDKKSEIKMLKVIKSLNSSSPLQIKPTFLGAHSVPDEFSGRQLDYIDYLIREVLPECIQNKLCDAVDIFCEPFAFSLESAEKLFKFSLDSGLDIKAHTDQFNMMGAAKLAAEMGAISCDHLEEMDESSALAMKNSNTIAVILPSAYYYLRMNKKPPIQMLSEYDIPMAIATDLNPGSSPCQSILIAMNQACVLFNMTVEQVLRGATINGAKALNIKNKGIIEKDYKADFCLWDVSSPAELIHSIGNSPLKSMYISGKKVS